MCIRDSAQTFDLGEARAILGQLTDTLPATSDDKLRVLLAEGVLFLAYLDRRCRYPIPFAPAFGAWLLMVCEYKKLLSRSEDYYRTSFKVTGAERVQVLPGFAFDATHDYLGDVLSEEVRRWFPARERADLALVEQWLNSLGSVTNGQA